MSILSSILVSAVGCFIALLFFVFCLCIYDRITDYYYDRKEQKERVYDDWNL